jgi:hypothetical protein
MFHVSKFHIAKQILQKPCQLLMLGFLFLFYRIALMRLEEWDIPNDQLDLRILADDINFSIVHSLHLTRVGQV